VAKADTASLIGVLNFALTLEHLEYRYYQLALDSGVIASADRVIFQKIRGHELAHVKFLQEVIGNVLKGTPVAEPKFDFTVKGAFSPFTDYPTFLALAQAFEDTGVRAYKGQAANMQESDVVLTAALSIHSVEARHASQVRRLRTKKGLDNRERMDYQCLNWNPAGRYNRYLCGRRKHYSRWSKCCQFDRNRCCRSI
jgi:rubrerythrin